MVVSLVNGSLTRLCMTLTSELNPEPPVHIHTPLMGSSAPPPDCIHWSGRGPLFNVLFHSGHATEKHSMSESKEKKTAQPKEKQK